MITLFMLAGCSKEKESEFTIRVSGTDGIKYSGSYGATGFGGDPAGNPIEGIVPEEYTVVGTVVSCFFQKKSGKGTLRVEIIKSGAVVAQSETSETEGVVLANAK
jgi:hypothetical protein